MSLFSPLRAGLCRFAAPLGTAALLSAGLLSAGLLSAGLLATGAGATPLTASEILGQFNLVVLGSSSSTSSVEGRSFIGGSLSGGDYNTRSYAPASAYDELVVGGSISGNIKVNNGGDATIGGSGSGVLEMNGGSVGNRTATFGGVYAGTFNQGTKLQNQAVTIPDFGTVLKAASLDLAGLGGSAPLVQNGNKGMFNRAADSTGITVYDIADGAGFFGAINEIQLSLAGASMVIVNVAGSNLTINDNFLGGPFAAASHVVWNFYEATALTLSTQFFGSVLAPLAMVTNTSAIEGTLVAGALNQRAQIHLQTMIGIIPSSITTQVPEAGSLAIAGLGMLGLCVAGRRRKAARAA